MAYPKRNLTALGRKCRTCLQDKPLTEYYTYKSKDKNFYFGVCKNCYGKATAERNSNLNFSRCTEKMECTNCKKVKDSSEFFRSRVRKTGILSFCKECEIQMQRKRREKYKISLRTLNFDTLLSGKKICVKCKELLDNIYFPISGARCSGLSSTCRRCILAYGWNKRFKPAQKLLTQDIPQIVPSTCSVCNWTFKFPICDIHHKVSPRKGGSINDPANLEILCPNCHRLRHIGQV